MIISLSGGLTAWSEATCIGRTDQPEPDLGFRVASEQPVRGDNFVRVALKSARLDIDGNEFTIILCAEMGLYPTLIDVVAPPSKLFLAVPRIRGGTHGAILHYQRDGIASVTPGDNPAP
jgi:hypothetical protein